MAKERHLKIFVSSETPLAAQQSYGHVPHFSTCPVCMVTGLLTFRHRASCILGQAFHYSPENALYILNRQIYLIF